MLRQKLGVKVRGIELSLLQRCGAHLASGSDLSEAFTVGKIAVESAIAGETDKMVAIKRVVDSEQVSFITELLPLSEVANFEKKVPLDWITPEHNFVTQQFVDYALPLIQGEPERTFENALPRYAKLKKILAK